MRRVGACFPFIRGHFVRCEPADESMREEAILLMVMLHWAGLERAKYEGATQQLRATHEA